MRIAVRAYAKINLHLAVHGRRPDGYHDLTTVFQTIALHDTLTAESRDGPFAFECDAEEVPADSTNLVWRAAELMAGEAGRELSGVRLRLHKRIPTQAGLGGGSADAMAALHALHVLWGLPIDAAALAGLGARLGSDVPFFAYGGTALGQGRGDRLVPLADLPECHVVVVRPPFGVSTADAYAWLAEARTGQGMPASAGAPARWPERSGDWPARLATMTNDFEPVVVGRHPGIGEAVARLKASGAALALMSGSGSAVAALFSTGTAARAAAAPFEREATARVWLSRTMPRADYHATRVVRNRP